ncbi:MAG: hypothetical protein ACXVCE_08680 [Bacteriovorax sp.]
MKTFYLKLSILSLLLLMSCSFSPLRDPAGSPVPTLQEVMSIESSKSQSDDGDEKLLRSTLKTYFSGVQFIESNSLGEGIAYKIELDLKNKKNIVRILHAKNAFNDHEATLHALTFLSNMSNDLNHHAVYEMYLNAGLKDPIALDNLLKLKSKKNDYLFYSNKKLKADYEAATEALNKRYEESARQRSALKDAIKKLQSERLALYEKRKMTLEPLDSALPENQLKALVARNDREGVAQLLKSYLPFEQMAPIEKKFWNDYLEVMRHPLPLNERIFVYRGLNDDMIYSALRNGVELDKETAIKESRAFLMSTIIVKNQGSWNRRLRSLLAMNQKFIGTVNESDEFSKSARISTMFQNHSQDPKGSPFLSFTPDFKIATVADGKYATDFGSKRVSAFLIDPRLLQYNYATIHDEEIEFLTNLVTFPDELVGIWDKDYHENLEPKNFLDEKLKQLMAESYGEDNVQENLIKIYQNSRDFYSPVYKFDPPFPIPATGKKAKALKTFLEQFIPKMPDASVAPIGCDQIVKKFF